MTVTHGGTDILCDLTLIILRVMEHQRQINNLFHSENLVFEFIYGG